MADCLVSLPAVILLMGVSGSGKSTIGAALSKRLGWPYADADEFHPPANVAKMSTGQPLTDDDRWPWLNAIAAHIDRVRAEGRNAIVSCSALKRVYRDILIGAREDVRLVLLDGTKEEIFARMSARKITSCRSVCSTASSRRWNGRARTSDRLSCRSMGRRRRSRCG